MPLIVFVALSEPIHADVMLEPGANRSRHVPQFENEERASVEVVAPSVIAFGVRAGVKLQASPLLFPAASAYVTPSAIEFVTAVSRAAFAPDPPRLMFATASSPGPWSPVTQSTPAMTWAQVPEPPQLRTRTATSDTLFATPYVEPPTVPPTCVPWP